MALVPAPLEKITTGRNGELSTAIGQLNPTQTMLVPMVAALITTRRLVSYFTKKLATMTTQSPTTADAHARVLVCLRPADLDAVDAVP